jgi:uncharacterized protein (DUF1778 family)
LKIMAEKKSEKKLGRRVTLRLPSDLSDLVKEIEDATGSTATDVIIESLRKAGKEVGDELGRARAAKLAKFQKR